MLAIVYVSYNLAYYTLETFKVLVLSVCMAVDILAIK